MRKLQIALNTVVAWIIVFVGINNLHADNSKIQFLQQKNTQQFMQYMIKKHHFNKQQLQATFAAAQYRPEIIEKMEKPYEKKNWDEYKALFLTQQRFNEGMKFWQDNAQDLTKAEKKYHVPASIIVAILGVETLYGKHQGDFKVIDALSTLSFNYPKRSKYFSYELEQYLLMCREQHVNPEYYMGSYAGAIGKPQFMPSSYRRFATHLDGARKIDIMNDNKAVIASIANYFNKHGWQTNQGIAQPATISNNAANKINTSQLKANYTLPKLKQIGITPVTAAINTPKLVGVVGFNTSSGSEYWLAYPNFYVITKYNTSPMYAMVVYLLANQFQKKWAYNNLKYSTAYA